jgi:hypothetical protein
MPNWCENDLYVKGGKEDIEAFIDFCKGKDDEGVEVNFDFNQFIPYPDTFKLQDGERDKWIKENSIEESSPSGNISAFLKLKEGSDWKDCPKDGYNTGGYEWCCKNWGTKWNVGTADFERTKGGVTITFSTAWAPPIPVIQAMGDKFPDLTFTLKYYEQGMAFQGIYQVSNGEVDFAEEKPYRGSRGG